MPTLFTAAALEELRDRLIPFGEQWSSETGRDLDTVEEGLDFLSHMKDRDDLWAILGAAETDAAGAAELHALRVSLPEAALDGKDVSVEDRLVRLGLSAGEVTSLLAAIASPEGVGDAIQEAFAAADPHHTARALEQILDTSPEVLTTDRHLRRYAGQQGSSRVLGSLLGVALFLIGAALAAPAQAGEAAKPVAGEKAADKDAAKSSKKKSPVAKKRPKKTPPSLSIPRYKGVSPRRTSRT